MNITDMWMGSPPHTRGILRLLFPDADIQRFTPAYAGNTGMCNSHSQGTQVHPRIRGEYDCEIPRALQAGGSPPHTRGILSAGATSSALSGFTPAYAGNTSLAETTIIVDKVHPRIRGEYFTLESPQIINSGSPPHTRGILCCRGA